MSNGIVWHDMRSASAVVCAAQGGASVLCCSGACGDIHVVCRPHIYQEIMSGVVCGSVRLLRVLIYIDVMVVGYMSYRQGVVLRFCCQELSVCVCGC